MYIQKTPEKNAILFVWFNQYAGILLKTPTKTLAIDPVEIKPKSLQNIDAILITHEHYDHLDPRLITEIQKTTNCTIIADSASTKKLQHAIPTEKLQEIKPGAEIKIGEVSVKAEKCNHNAQAPVTYIITSEDEVKVYHTADSLPFPELAAIGQREKFDVVFCTVGIAPGSTPQTGFEIARLTKPQVAVPYHTASTASQTQFAEILKKELPRTACLIPEQNKIYQVSKRK
ncbi:MAG: MBL fold metallo-hydrolase [Candidatus Bathyarchaeota archaeon]|jgi:L-ascorbate metabolism protein UlaG (beta-lactamase superfamily)|nr:MBL fold metallo-hydrolase [Candidatus Bathyarchaeota archaeon]